MCPLIACEGGIKERIFLISSSFSLSVILRSSIGRLQEWKLKTREKSRQTEAAADPVVKFIAHRCTMASTVASSAAFRRMRGRKSHPTAETEAAHFLVHVLADFFFFFSLSFSSSHSQAAKYMCFSHGDNPAFYGHIMDRSRESASACKECVSGCDCV